MHSLSVADLQDSEQFDRLTTLGHTEIAAFAKEYYWLRRSWITWAHYALSIVILAALLRVGFVEHLGFDAWMTRFGNAVLSFIVLLPLHEWLHGVAYRLHGARDIRYGVNLRKLYAYAVAHNFVIGRRGFAWVAITPFLVITAGLVVATVIFDAHRFFLAGVLLLHTAGTSGDFAMLNYLWLHSHREVYTYDDADSHTSYFYARRCSATPR